MRKIDNLTSSALSDVVQEFGEPSFRGKQIYSWLFKAGVSSFDEMTNLSKDFRRVLAENFSFTVLEEVKRTVSSDGSVKFLFRLEDGETVESVLLRDGDRISGCISTQAGCRMGCRFCATAGAVGFKRNLTAAEIIRQIMYLRMAAYDLFDQRLGNLVFMGMGEPLDNIVNLKNALSVILDDEALGFSHRKVTVSTCGLIKGIKELFKMPTPVNLAVSVNAPSQEVRAQIMPISKKYPLTELINTLKTIELDKRKRITLEYVLLGGVNDSLGDAARFAKLIKGIPAKVNLIIYNSSKYSSFKTPDEHKVLKFQEYLVNNNISAFIRKRLGADIDGACGQLAAGYKGIKGDKNVK